MTEKEFKPELYIHLDGDLRDLPDNEKLLQGIIDYYTPLLEVTENLLNGGSLSPEQEEESRQIHSRVKEVRDSWIQTLQYYSSPDITEERNKEIAISVSEWYANLVLFHAYNKDPEMTSIPPYRVEIDPDTLKPRRVDGKTYLWGDKYFVPGEGILSLPPENTRDLLADLEEIRKASKSGLFKVSKDLLESQIHSSPGDALDLIKDEKIKRRIQRKAEKGEYIAGTLVGLSGGERYFKIFCLALAQTLNEQSKYYHTQEDLSGIPKELLSQYAGEGAIVDKIKDPSPLFKGGGTRPYPIVFLSWEDLAKKMSATGEIAGGKDIKQVRDYVLGGTVKKKDKETGVEKETYIHGLLDREFLIEGTKGIVGVPLMTKILSLYPKDSPDKEVGIAVQLSPLFALKKIIGYTGIRSDTIQLLGGGKQRELTLNLFMYLAYYRNVPPQTGRKKGEFVQRKKDLLPEISRGIAYYAGRPGLLEKHFQEAVQKCIDAKILLPGTVKGAIKGYREEINPGGERLSIFVYNPDYLKGEEVNLFSEVEEQ